VPSTRSPPRRWPGAGCYDPDAMATPLRDETEPRPKAGTSVASQVLAYGTNGVEERPDQLAAEEPLELRVSAEQEGHRRRRTVAITMRTPGHDLDLAAGFLLSEGVIADAGAIWRIAHCPDSVEGNIVDVDLGPEVAFDPERFSRNVYTTSSCGICGKTSIALVRALCRSPAAGSARFAPAVIRGLAETLRAAQAVFSRTGGLHAAGLFTAAGELLLLREDVGRHNAVDKVVGAQLLDRRLPATDRLLLVSGRASFELVQKALVAGIPALAAVGAPSSLAVELARDFGLTLIGFLRDGRFNVYAGSERIG
jgi:FdhD protein